MTVKFNLELFDNAEQFTDLNRVIDLAVQGRYNILLKDIEILDSRWYSKTSSIESQFIKSTIEKSINYGNHDLEIRTKNKIDENKISLKDGYQFLIEPVFIFIENADKDEKFLRGIWTHFKEGRLIKKFYKKRWLQFKHLGGKNDAINQINQHLRSFRQFDLPNHKYLRGFILLDSDKKRGDESYSEDLNRIIEYCSEKGIYTHVLYKREMENYLPMKLLRENENVDQEVLSAFLDMTDEQKDFYDIEKGFKNISYRNLPDLFSNLSKDDYNILRKGFSTSNFNTKKEIPKLFLEKDINDDILLKRCKHQPEHLELRNILKIILKLI